MTKRRDRLYWIWSAMLDRCRNSKNTAYANYGGRGIAVCERWVRFENFKSDMGDRPEGKSLDRINNDLGYSPENCRWVSRQEQNSNRRNCIFVECEGSRVTLKEYCRRHQLPYRPIVKRIQDRNWPMDLALSVPIGSGKQFKRVPV
jgi:hypothetical protein